MKVPSTQLQNNFGHYLKIAESGEAVIVTRNGKDVAKIVANDDKQSEIVKEDRASYADGDRWVTYEQFLELTAASEQRYELIDGKIYLLASPVYDHQHIVKELLVTFHYWFKGEGCTPLTSPFDVTLKKAEDNICVVQPDIMIICDQDRINQQGKYFGVPTLVIEVLSPSSRSKDMVQKLDLYHKCGVQEYWVVDPKRQHIFIYVLKDTEVEDVLSFQKRSDEYAYSVCFEGLKANLEELFNM